MAKQRDPEPLCFAFAAAGTKDVVAFAITGTGEVTHVFDETEHGDVHFVEHRRGFPGIDQRHFLRSGDNDRAGERDRLDYGELDVAGAGRKIEHEIIQFAPFDLPQELLSITGHHRSAQDRGRRVVEEKTHRHQFQSVLFDRNDAVVLGSHRPIARAEHERNARAVDVAIAKTNARFRFFECDREIRRHR